ncbi:hypothetical protein [Flammeovirga aprica]|uniref:Uncharacterized protein n=1 Tax=Flammeovirga aprica JL-4 TaxID=694437 RepID=A0A7X9RXG9_9BACT|nr:hypothetical protein [Flammeovirga aprica]NME70546.1 hypothetical protein [Flammeovirga aprica JL-4]
MRYLKVSLENAEEEDKQYYYDVKSKLGKGGDYEELQAENKKLKKKIKSLKKERDEYKELISLFKSKLDV